MGRFVEQNSEIGKLNTVILHRPGVEISQLMPEYLEQMLAEDTPYLPAAQHEHDVFSKILTDNGVEVLYMGDLFAEAVKDDEVRRRFVEDYVARALVAGPSLRRTVYEYLISKTPTELHYEVCKGIMRSDIMDMAPRSLQLSIREEYPMVTEPIPNSYFTRDVGVAIGRGMLLCRMNKKARRGEMLVMQYVHDYNPRFTAEDVPVWYDDKYSIEGGDVLVLSENTLAIGCGERTEAAAIEGLALNLFRNGYERILLFKNPASRKYMHLDVLCTMIDRDTFLTHPEIAGKLYDVYELTPARGGVNVSLTTDPLRKTFARVLGVPSVRFIEVGGGDPVAMSREHWNMGGNSLAISPGNIVVYDRNEVTNDLLVKAGITIHPIPGGELSRGRGGPRCMSQPINRSAL